MTVPEELATNLNLDLDLASTAPDLPTAQQFRTWVSATLGPDHPAAELALRLVDGPEMQALNRQYRGLDRTTNVLSFPANLPPDIPLNHLGDIVLCAPVIQREAMEQNKPPLNHWAHLVVHGVLHLLGHDHQQPAEAEAMETLERCVLASLDIRDPYA